MSQLHARLFEKWLAAGDDRTFAEWLAYRRECATQERARRALYGKHANVELGLQQLGAQQILLMQQHQRGLPMLLGQAFGGIFR